MPSSQSLSPTRAHSLSPSRSPLTHLLLVPLPDLSSPASPRRRRRLAGLSSPSSPPRRPLLPVFTGLSSPPFLPTTARFLPFSLPPRHPVSSHQKPTTACVKKLDFLGAVDELLGGVGAGSACVMWSRGETTTFSRASGREQQRSWRRARQSTAEKSQAMVSRRQLVVVLVMQWMVRSHGGDTAALDLFSGATLATSCRPRRGLSISPSATSTTTPPPARESYLTAAAIVDAALRTGAKEKYECVLKANGNLEKQVLSLEVLLSSKDEAATGDGGASSSRGWWPGRG